jgi:murein DD-endopeptidase MepM/ murein hydrolase activator NlpD
LTSQRKKDKRERIFAMFSWSIFFLLLWLGMAGPLFAATPAEPFFEEGVPPGRGAANRDLLLPPRELSPFQGLESLRHVTHRVRPGDTLTKLFVGFGLSQQQRHTWLGSIQRHYPTKGLRTGKEIHFYFTKPDPSLGRQPGKQHLKALEIELDEDWVATWEQGTRGVVFSKREKPYDIDLKTTGGVIESSLFEDGPRAGLNQSLLSQLADIFSWDIDFDKEIQKGDTFKLLYEERSRKGRGIKNSFRILAAELISAGQKYFAIYFEKERGKGSYYDLHGRSLARAFLRFPLEFTSISSHFSHSRFHPILKVDRPHYGVDFVARRGTPVRAIGDGKILHAGWKRGGYGRMVEIQHDSLYSSRSAHLGGLARGMTKGMTVKKGQIVGYVGSSGMSTGPHLHFEFYKDQQYVDPLQFEIPPEDRIEPALQRLFENAKQLFLAELAATPHS